MYSIEKAPYGYRVTASGQMDIDEAEKLRIQLIGTLTELGAPFSLVIDLRKLIPISADVSQVMMDMQRACAQMSLQRVALIIESPVVKGQSRQITYDADTEKHDRVINALSVPDWEEVAVAWVADGVDPETKSTSRQSSI